MSTSEQSQPGVGAVSRRAALAGAGAAAAGLAMPASAGAAPVRSADETVLVEVVGQIVQDVNSLTGFGYVTSLSGIATSALFHGAHDETGALFTWTAAATVAERFVRGSMIAVTAPGTLTIHHGTGGGNFSDPSTFAAGTPIAHFDAHYDNALAIIAPQQGIATVEGELRQRSARGFTVAGHGHRLGRRGARLQLGASGPGRRNLDPNNPQASFDVVGRIVAG